MSILLIGGAKIKITRIPLALMEQIIEQGIDNPQLFAFKACRDILGMGYGMSDVDDRSSKDTPVLTSRIQTDVFWET